MKIKFSGLEDILVITIYSDRKNYFMKKSLKLLIFKPISIGANNIIENETIKSLFFTYTLQWRLLLNINAYNLKDDCLVLGNHLFCCIIILI